MVYCTQNPDKIATSWSPTIPYLTALGGVPFILVDWFPVDIPTSSSWYLWTGQHYRVVLIQSEDMTIPSLSYIVKSPTRYPHHVIPLLSLFLCICRCPWISDGRSLLLSSANILATDSLYLGVVGMSIYSKHDPIL